MVFALALFTTPSHATAYWGMCPTVSVKSPFTLGPYLGNWYEIARDWSGTSYEWGMECTTATYTSIGEYVEVKNQAVNLLGF